MSVLVLSHHAVSETWPASLSVTPDRLREQLLFLISRGYRGTTFLQATTAPPQERILAVTFDDAYRSVLSLAFPILCELGLPGTVFAPTSFIDSERPMSWPGIDQWLGGPHQDELIPMSWQDLDKLAAAGWEIGSHTRSHPRLTELADTALADELLGSRLECEQHLGRRCLSLAYPYGDVDSRVIEAARRADYLAGATLPERLPVARPLSWPRVGVYHRDSQRRFRLKVWGPMRWLRSWKLWEIAIGVRRYVNSLGVRRRIDPRRLRSRND